jgi:hypothetical protein
MAVWLLVLSVAGADDFAELCANRMAIEHVYYTHRLGTGLPFEQVAPQALIERLVREDLRKEAVLRKVYDVEITQALLEAEVQRINANTRAHETLTEIKATLDNNPVKFAQSFAKPFLVERLLRDKFENDDALHSANRHACETARTALLAAKANGATPAQLLAQLKQVDSNAVTETTWQLTARPSETGAPYAEELEIKKRFGQNARLISSLLGESRERKHYFADLPPALQRVLRVQLRQPGDVSAVIETPTAFLLYLSIERSETALATACLSLPKSSCKQWVAEQGETSLNKKRSRN